MESNAKPYTDEYLSRRYREFKSDKNIEIKYKLMQRLQDRFTTPILYINGDLSMQFDHKWINDEAKAQFDQHRADLDKYIKTAYADLVIYRGG